MTNLQRIEFNMAFNKTIYDDDVALDRLRKEYPYEEDILDKKTMDKLDNMTKSLILDFVKKSF